MTAAKHNTSIAEKALGAKLSRYAPFRDQLLPHQKLLLEHVEKEGYCILPRAFSAETVRRTKLVIGELERTQTGPAGAGGRNTFEGLHTKRLYAIFNKSREFDQFATHPDVLALNRAILGGGNLITSAQTICIEPGEEPQDLHYDDGIVPLPRPRESLTAAIMVALDDYTESNGATVVVKRSHRWLEGRLPERREAEPVVMPAGSILYFVGQLWHGGGKNVSRAPRNALTVQYCAGWIRPTENQFLAVSPEVLRTIESKALLDMLGHSIYPPFTGYANGMHPRIAAEALADRLLEAEARSKAKL